MKMKRHSDNKGFSLVELMVVVAIIGILTVVATPAYFNYINRTRQANAVQKLVDLKTAQEKYYALYDRYAPAPITAGTFSNLLSFNPSDTQYYRFSMTGTLNSFAGTIGGNSPSLTGDCWQITQAWADPATCGPGPAGFSWSVIFGIFD